MLCFKKPESLSSGLLPLRIPQPLDLIASEQYLARSQADGGQTVGRCVYREILNMGISGWYQR